MHNNKPKTYDELSYRTCRTCGIEKAITQFTVRDSFPDGSRNYSFKCKTCKNKYEQLRKLKLQGENIEEEYAKCLTQAVDKIPRDEQGLRYYNGRLLLNQLYTKPEKTDKTEKTGKKIRKSFLIEVDLAEKLDNVTNKSALLNILLRNHFC